MPEHLTARRLETVKPPEKGQAEIIDREQRGLCFRLTSRGERAWYLRIKIDGRSRRFVIGPYPEISLAEARKRAARLRLEVIEGADPIEERRRARAQNLAQTSLAEILYIYANAHLSTLARGHEVESALRSSLATHLANPANAVTQTRRAPPSCRRGCRAHRRIRLPLRSGPCQTSAQSAHPHCRRMRTVFRFRDSHPHAACERAVRD